MARTDNLRNYLTDIANAIKEKKGNKAPILASNFDTEIKNLQSGSSGGSNNIFTGSFDKAGLKAIGWTSEEIDYYNANGVQWFEEQNDLFKLTDEELLGDESKNTRFLPKNSSKNIFTGYKELMAIPKLDTSLMSDMTSMFHGCKSLVIIPYIDTSNVTNMKNMFYGSDSLLTIPLLNTKNVTNMYFMFHSCAALKLIPNLDTSKVTNMYYMFYGCSSLKTIPQLDVSNVTTINSIFQNCSKLKNIGGLLNCGKSFKEKIANNSDYTFNISNCNEATRESLLNVINGLYDLNLTYDVANGGTLYTQKLQLGTTNKAKLTAEELSLATNKGWTIA